MAFRNSGNGPTTYSLNTDEQSILRSVVQSSQFTGMSASAIAVKLNTSRTVPNPQPPVMYDRTEIPRVNLQAMLLSIILAMKAQQTPDEAKIANWDYVLQNVRGMDVASFLPADLSRWIAMAQEDGIITDEQIDILLKYPDPNWQAVITLPGLSLTMFSEPTWLQDVDIQAVLGS